MLEDLFKVVKTRFNQDTDKTPVEREITIPENLLFKCPRCANVIYMEEFESNHKICPKCKYHARLCWKERLELIADKESFKEFDKGMTSVNPLNFPEYTKKVDKLKVDLDMNEAVVTGEITIRGYRTVVGIMDSRFMMASMGSVVGEKITRALEYATGNKLPIIIFTASGGARMQEGIISLMQMAKTSGAVARHNEAGLLYIAVLTDPTTGGVTASFASLGDIIIAEPKVLVGFAGRRVIQDTIRQRLPDDFQTAEFQLENGFVDMIVDRSQLRKRLSWLLKLHGSPKEAFKR